MKRKNPQHRAMAENNTKEEKFVKKLNFASSTIASDWKAFKGQFQIYQIAKKYSTMSEEEQICNMLVQMGCDSVKIYDQFKYDEGADATKKTLKNTIKFFDDYFEPVKNVTFERVKFNRLHQGELSIHQYIVILQEQAKYCEYGAMMDDLIKDRIVVGVKDNKLREYLIDLEELDLNKCIQKAKQFTSNHGQTAQFQGTTEENLDEVSSRKQKWKKSAEFTPSKENPCKFCGKAFHRLKTCPARESECRSCGKKGHWATSKICTGQKSKHMNEVNLDEGKEDEECLEGLYLGESKQ